MAGYLILHDGLLYPDIVKSTELSEAQSKAYFVKGNSVVFQGFRKMKTEDTNTISKTDDGVKRNYREKKPRAYFVTS